MCIRDSYSAEEIKAVLAGKAKHTPKRQAPVSALPKKQNNLLIDIQAKLAEGKGAGYANWAKRYNLKQMAQTVAFLQDHGLMDYEVLSEKASLAAEKYHKLSDEIRSAEQRLAEIAALEKSIVDYAKTRDTYVAYRKAGYSKAFRAEHESDILLHQAAKNYFDSIGVKKLPTVKSLKAEYAELLAKKKAAYSEYRKSREAMRELLTAKANVEQILGITRKENLLQEKSK